jgi:hypothetical protein
MSLGRHQMEVLKGPPEMQSINNVTSQQPVLSIQPHTLLQFHTDSEQTDPESL